MPHRLLTLLLELNEPPDADGTMAHSSISKGKIK